MRLQNKISIVTGAAGLVGPAYLEALIKEGASVVLADRDTESLSTLLKNDQYAAFKHKIRVFQMDISKKTDWIDLNQFVLKEFGKIDILVNNAAITNQTKSKGYEKSFFHYPDEDWNAVMEVNLTGTFLGCQIIGKTMVDAAYGSIINIASFYGIQSPNHKMYPGTGIFQPPAYMVSKAGVIALTKYLATYLGETGVRVNCISPGGIFNNHSEIFLERFAKLNPMGRMAQKEEMTGALLYLASDESSYCTGHNMIIDGGWSAW